MENQIRTIIVDDRKFIRDLFRMVLQQEDGIQIVGEAANGPQLFHLISDLAPDVLLLNLALPNTDLLEVFPAIRKKSPHTRTLLFSDSKGEGDAFKSLKAGARGFISFGETHTGLVKAIQTVHGGELWVSRKQMASFFDSEVIVKGRYNDTLEIKRELLTAREKETLKCLTTGCTNKEIANTLFISEKTVKCHLNSVFKKLNVTRRVDATLYAINRGMTL
jgi:DNA-binding NarL/FixJ family response regulator